MRRLRHTILALCCAAGLACGVEPPGAGAVCSDDDACAAGWCDRGIMGVGVCVTWKPDGEGCDRGEECLGGVCDGEFRCRGAH